MRIAVGADHGGYPLNERVIEELRQTGHEITDFGTHGIVDVDLPDGFRFKAMVPEAREWKAGQKVDLKPRAFSAYRDNAVIYRSQAAS